jgi:hypothetical protein
MHSYLQTKAVSLALEAKYIRQQEIRFAKKARKARLVNKDRQAAWLEQNRVGQYLHRIDIVRNEARLTNIARGFLTGKEYSKIERSAWNEPTWYKPANGSPYRTSVEGLILSYGDRSNPKHNQPIEERFAAWLERAKSYFAENKLQPPEYVRLENGRRKRVNA